MILYSKRPLPATNFLEVDVPPYQRKTKKKVKLKLKRSSNPDALINPVAAAQLARELGFHRDSKRRQIKVSE